MTAATPWQALAARRGYVLVDGGLASELVERGECLDGGLWSAALLVDRGEAIVRAHRAFLEAGSDVLVSASYQASFEGFAAAGHDDATAVRCLRRSVTLARTARDALRPSALVAASVGPYGAMLGGGAEYHGDYRVEASVLRAFHRRRLAVLDDAGADLVAVETLPCGSEARVLASLLNEHRGPPAWVSFSCRDGGHLRDGTPLEQAVAAFDDVERVRAIGVNCTDPGWVEALVKRLAKVAAGRDIVVYPNLGGAYDGAGRHWHPGLPADEFAALATRWYDAGARLIGGCCRVGPALIGALGDRLDRLVKPADRTNEEEQP